MLVETASGALHYTRSFSDGFDVRHPKTERLNFAALIFALQNFAGSSVRSVENADGLGEGLRTRNSAEITMFNTSVENMVLTTTPSSGLLVVLFTAPNFDVEVAKWIVHRVAFNYDNCDAADMQLTLNQAHRRFRQAFSQTIDEAVERELIRFCESVLVTKQGEEDPSADSFGDGELFLFFYYSPRLSDSRSCGGCDIESGSKTSSEEEGGNAARADDPMMSKKLCIRDMVCDVATRMKGKPSTKRKSEKRGRWSSRNAVIDHSEPHEFQRVLEVHSQEMSATIMEPQRTEKARGIAGVLVPFVKVSSRSLFSSEGAHFPLSKMTQQRTQQLTHFIWTNIPVASSAKEKPHAGTNVMAWRLGPCVVFYPITPVCGNPESQPRVQLAVTALFDVLEPLLNAKTKTRV
ncbi:hypothetical protein GN244_ATG20973 [Phytophthora infestans]|uniref:Uncharacterized protein n=1 Tax=Phytophthora infestans TaxID=4787 RepID=A0A833WBV2_PHYIN|nr:hypothetical protein GN244_ATG20973 [Phytophthora infestans]